MLPRVELMMFGSGSEFDFLAWPLTIQSDSPPPPDSGLFLVAI